MRCSARKITHISSFQSSVTHEGLRPSVTASNPGFVLTGYVHHPPCGNQFAFTFHIRPTLKLPGSSSVDWSVSVSLRTGYTGHGPMTTICFDKREQTDGKLLSVTEPCEPSSLGGHNSEVLCPRCRRVSARGTTLHLCMIRVGSFCIPRQNLSSEIGHELEQHGIERLFCFFFTLSHMPPQPSPHRILLCLESSFFTTYSSCHHCLQPDICDQQTNRQRARYFQGGKPHVYDTDSKSWHTSAQVLVKMQLKSTTQLDL